VIVADTNLVAAPLLPSDQAAAAEQVFAADPAWALPVLWRSEWRVVLLQYATTVPTDARSCSACQS
jgi:hypothetical protein